jgi:hypothetical protein
MVQVPSLQFPGQGGQAALPPGYRPSDFPGNGKPTPPPHVGAPGAPIARPAAPGVGIPDNFWGFVMIMMGMR